LTSDFEKELGFIGGKPAENKLIFLHAYPRKQSVD